MSKKAGNSVSLASDIVVVLADGPLKFSVDEFSRDIGRPRPHDNYIRLIYLFMPVMQSGLTPWDL